MCQYNDRCPTTRHRPGTVCPVEVREQNRAEREANKTFAAVISLSLTVIALGAVWFFTTR